MRLRESRRTVRGEWRGVTERRWWKAPASAAKEEWLPLTPINVLQSGVSR
jgi:hypothetical protein